jgi:hypothetical protein
MLRDCLQNTKLTHFLHALQGVKLVTKYLSQFDTENSITVTAKLKTKSSKKGGGTYWPVKKIVSLANPFYSLITSTTIQSYLRYIKTAVDKQF